MNVSSGKNLIGWFLAVAAGLLLASAFLKIDFAGGAWIAPGLLAFAVQNKRGSGAFRIGYIAGLSFWLVSLYWLLEIPYRWHSIPLGPGVGWLALCLALSLFVATWGWFVSDEWPICRFWGGRLLWSLAGAAAWVALEMVRARILGGFPWNLLGASQYKMTPLIQIASVTGVYGVSFLVVWTSLSFYSAVRMVFANPSSRFAWQPEVFPPLLAVAILFALGEVKVSQPGSPTETLRVVLAQPSIPQDLIWDENENSNRFQQLLQLSESTVTNGTDLLVWPESAVPELDDDTYKAITKLVAENRVWLIFDSDDVQPRANATNEYDNDVFNAAFLLGPNGEAPVVYHKQKLVMFGEYIPLVNWLPFVKWFTPITGGYTPGHAAVAFDLDSLHAVASPLICYEDMFPQTGRKAAETGADFLVNLTNDGWFGQSAEQWQHERSGIFRAVENGLPLMRCCNNGITCWIDANGRQHKIFRDENGTVYGAGTMAFDLPLQKHEPTFYTRHGDSFGWGCTGIFLLLSGFKLARK
jgi:apolipoprotein N-acyltransferase